MQSLAALGVVAITVGALGSLAWFVSRRAFLAASLGVIAAALTYAASRHAPTRVADPRDMIASGADRIARDVVPGFHPSTTLGPLGWAVLAAATAGILLLLDAVAARREPPSVEVRGPVGDGDDTIKELQIRRRLSEELRFVLPAVNVTRPGGMPGASGLDRVAAIEETDIDSAKKAMAVTRLLAALRPRPRAFQVGMFVESCDADGRLCCDGTLVRLTVDLRDARTGQSVFSTVSGPEREVDAAEWVAAVVARQVLQWDPSVPSWALGSPGGDDLRAYLMARTIRPTDRTYAAALRARRERRGILENALRESREGGVARYELAALEEMDGRPVHALRQHLLTRCLHPRFRTGRYRAAMSLSMVGGRDFAVLWQATPGEVRRDIARLLDRAGLLRDLERGEAGRRLVVCDALAAPEPGPRQLEHIRRAFLQIAIAEFDALVKADHLPLLLLHALRRRDERADLLSRMRRRLRSAGAYSSECGLARDIADLRLRSMQGAADDATRAQAQRRWRRRLRLDGVLGEGTRVPARLHWKVLYNAACLQVLQLDERPVVEADVRDAVELLRLALSTPGCDLDRPSEWLALDPDLRHLRGRAAYDELIEELAARDFAAGEYDHGGDPWFWRFVEAPPAHGTRWVAALITPGARERAADNGYG